MFSALLAIAFLPIAHADPAVVARDEMVTRQLEQEFAAGVRGPIEPYELDEHDTRLMLDAAENLLATGNRAPLAGLTYGFAWTHLPPKEQARWLRLTGFAREEDLAASLSWAPPERGLLYELLLLEPRMRTRELRGQLGRMEAAFYFETLAYRGLKSPAWAPPSAQLVHSLFFDPVDAEDFEKGEYANKARLFLFCRHDRNYPCLLAMKDGNDNPVRMGQKLWTQPGLGLSGYGKPFNERLGNTPQGVQLVDSVMPEANQYEDFGAYRRLILEFPAPSTGEADMRRLLPAAATVSDWWRESAIARDVGREELRIHGTGLRNNQPQVPFYPFIATIGCVAQRELEYDGVDYVDQRHLLDRVMQAERLEPTFDNEPSIRALLYVIDIDDQKKAVTTADLARYGIE